MQCKALFINSVGGTAFISFKSNATGKPQGKSHMWRKMYDYFTFNREEFMRHYHLRSNVETTNYMIKSKFMDFVRSKDRTAQVNEVLLKILCHNIVVLVHEMNELEKYRQRRQHKVEARDKTRVIQLSNRQLLVTVPREIARWKHISKGTLLKWSGRGSNRIIIEEFKYLILQREV